MFSQRVVAEISEKGQASDLSLNGARREILENDNLRVAFHFVFIRDASCETSVCYKSVFTCKNWNFHTTTWQVNV